MGKPSRRIKNGAVPQGATHFQVYKLRRADGVSADGRKYQTWRSKRCFGDPDAEGRVTDAWALREFSAAAIRHKWGPARYRIRYVTETGELLGQEDVTLETPPEEIGGEPIDQPEAAGAPAATMGSPMARLRGMAGRTLDGGGLLELVLLMQEGNDRAAARAREEAGRQAERDRQFWSQMQQQQQQTLALFTGTGAGGVAAAAGGGRTVVRGTSKRELRLLRRELALEIREEMARVKTEVLSEIDDDEPPPEKPAKNVGEATSRAGIAAVEGLGELAPGLVNDALGALRSWLKARGQDGNPAQVQAAIAAVQAAALAEAQANANGAE